MQISGSMNQRFVVSRRRTGFGDCLWSLAAAWSYAKRTHRTLAIDWRGSCYLDQPFVNAFSVFFEPIQDIAGVRVICDDQINQFSFPGPFFPRWWNKPSIDSIFRPDEQIFRERDELRQLFESQADCDANTVVCDACLMWGCGEDAERQIFRSVRPRSEIQRRIDAIYRDQFAGHSIIGVHVRHGNGEDIMGHTPYWADPEFALQQVCMAIHKVKESPHPKPVKVLLCTDSAQVLERLTAAFPELMTIPKHFLTQQAGPLHSPALGVDGGVSALVEMYLLARCDTVIRFPPTSAFTRYARLFVPRIVEFDLNDPSRITVIEELPGDLELRESLNLVDSSR
ncbi:nodulation protein NodZ [Bradyrhizobium pachyrhizi]|uniref:NodZ n=2 Tax=Bradyrhizobium TaxID=374 RepID=I2AWH6_BRAEL|nr:MULTISPECIES: nodulation protein NodZ [Bradyrhizobium]AFJ42518.1 NodZ [Bradyrhizobium elkanii]WFU54571.1 nodulation protein NodZ [Bradyrhizobium pachyrhizi]WOH80211.1 nodulation protein NodZ [Bradyrhizobium sp. BEA-2-5]